MLSEMMDIMDIEQQRPEAEGYRAHVGGFDLIYNDEVPGQVRGTSSADRIHEGGRRNPPPKQSDAHCHSLL